MNSHGDVVQLLNQSGKVAKTYEYDSFGNEVNPDKDDDNPFRYSGEYYDKETESIYLRARYYQPSVGRFLTRDTYTGEDDDPLSLNLYTYCGNDGVNNVDPSGHFFETIADILSLGDSLYCMVEEPSLVNAGFVAWDVVSLLPGVPGSYVAKLTKKASKAAEVVKASKAGTKVKVAMEKGKKIVKASKKAVAKLAKKLKPKKSLKKISPGNNKFLKKTGKSGGKKPKKVNSKSVRTKSVDIHNSVLDNIRSGSALKKDQLHAFNNIIDNYAGYAKKFQIVGGDGVKRSLYQLEGSLNGKKGIFEWIVDSNPQKGVTHRRFIEGVGITGKPNARP